MKRLAMLLLLLAPAPPALAQHEGHGAPPPDADPHAGHGAPPEASPVAPPPNSALSGPAHAADAVYGAEAMAQAREELRSSHGEIRTQRIMIDQLEAVMSRGGDGYRWDADAWFGGDIDRFRLTTEGEGRFGEGVEEAEVQALFSHAIDPWFNLQGGLRYDLRPDPRRAHLVLGIQGLAPYWFEVDAALFLSNKGELTARLEAEHDQRITQKLILQPRIEFDLAAQDVPSLGIRAGLSEAEAGLRLRYEFVPEFAPYLGVQYQRRFGADAGGWALLAGIRAWF